MSGAGVYLIFIGIGIVITILTIRTAIDNSRTAEEITEIRRLLTTLVDNSEKLKLQTDKKEEEQENYEVLDTPIDTCPACGTKITEADKNCPSCGITLE